jgi:hypothetical protein
MRQAFHININLPFRVQDQRWEAPPLPSMLEALKHICVSSREDGRSSNADFVGGDAGYATDKLVKKRVNKTRD